MTSATRRPVAVVSGASGRLGAELTGELLSDGWAVAGFSRSRGKGVERHERSHPEHYLWRSVDVRDSAAVRAFVREVDAVHHRLDLLVNNVGVLAQGLFVTMPEREMTEVIETNLSGPLALTQECVRVMVRGRSGSIVNISSINSVRGYKGVSVYAAAKAGVDGLTRSLARELGAANIRVNSVVPGYFDSDLTADVTSENRGRIERRTPLGRLGRPEDVTAAVRFRGSASASFITGQNIVIDGGITC